jgi:hypothetical protein
VRKTLVLFVLPLLAFAGTVTKTVTFESADLHITQANGYDVVRLGDLASTGETGRPQLPEAVFNVVVPAGATVTDVKVTAADPYQLPGSFRVHPAQPPVQLSSRTRPEFVRPDAGTYSSSAPYPPALSSWDGYTGTKSGWRLCGFAAYPVSYEPAAGRITLYQRLTVTVTWRDADVTPPTLSRGQLENLAAGVRRIVLNREDVDRFAPPKRERDNMDCDYAIVTSSALVGNWATLAEWRTRKGLYTRIFSIDTVAARYAGRDRQEKLRNFIIDYFYNHGLQAVLLAGDNATIPGRRGRVTVSTETGNIPADLYYGDLQWSWDGNNNNVFGEMSGDTVDLYYDVAVGRASVDDAAQVATFVNKVLLYEKTPTTDYLQKMLLPYVNLFPDNGYSGQVVSESIANHTPAGWTDTYIANPTTTTPIRDAINQGYHFVHGAAHGDDYGWYTYYGQTVYSTTVASGQTNSTRPSIVNSLACITGNFEANDCLAEALMTNPNGGAVAVMMNSREGWGTPPSMGPSEKMDFQFYKFVLDEDSGALGGLHSHSKDFFASSARSQAVWRWCYYDLNLFGDPDMPVWHGVPGTLAVAGADTITTGPQSYTVNVTSGGNPLFGALVSCYKPGEFHTTARTASNGNASITLNPLTPGVMYLTVSTGNHIAFEQQVVVNLGTPQPYLSIRSYWVDDGGNGQLDPGENVDIYATVQNLGTATATGVVGTLREASSDITLSDSTSSYGTLAQGDSARGDAFHLAVAPGAAPGSQVQFTLHLSSDEGTWDPTFTLTIGTPLPPGSVTLDHDTGYCRLTVTAVGSLGYTEPPARDVGNGFCYPKANLTSHLYYGSFMFGNSPTYLVDRHYGNPPTGGPNTDFAIVDSLRPVLPGWSDEHYRTVMSDAGHAAPKNIRVTMNSHQVAASGYDDFVVLQYDVHNSGGTAVNDLYAGIIIDFDVVDGATNTVVSNESKRFTYVRQASNANPCVGLKILDPTSFANLCAVDHDLYVYPDSAMTDGMKYRIINGTIQQRNSSRSYDWSAGVSVGPFSLAPGADYHCAFAVVGGTSAAEFEAHTDSAQSWYDRGLGVKADAGLSGVRPDISLTCAPNPFNRTLGVSFQVPVAGRVRASVIDVTGRVLATLVDGELPAGRFATSWQPGELAEGIYLLQVRQPAGATTVKLTRLH